MSKISDCDLKVLSFAEVIYKATDYHHDIPKLACKDCHPGVAFIGAPTYI